MSILSPDSIPIGVNKCPKHNCWVKKSRSHHPPRITHRYCPMCVTEAIKANPNYTDKSTPTGIRKITL